MAADLGRASKTPPSLLLGYGLDAGVVVVPESGSTSAVSRLVGQDERDLAGAFVWDYAMALLMRESFTDEGVVAAVQ